jgi:hypothetical protein
MMTKWQDELDKIHSDAAEAPRYRDDLKRLADAHVRLTQVVSQVTESHLRLVKQVEKLTQAAHLQSAINKTQTCIDDNFTAALSPPKTLEVVL